MTPERNPLEPLPEASSPAERPLAVDSRDLLGAEGDLFINHGGRIYRLRRTRVGKLILTA